MCMPCCNLCGEKYLENDGTIDSARLREARLHALELNRGNPRAVAALAEPFTDDRPACDCECHRDGWNVLH